MRLCVISDTHIPDRYEDVPVSVNSALKDADLIIHAGDFTSVEYFRALESTKKLKAVLGNLDEPDLKKYLKEKEVFVISKYKIGLIHGFGKAENVLENAQKSFDETFDLIIFGHTHNPINKKIGKTVFFNPGSPTDKIFAAYNSYGIIDLNDTIDAKILKI